MFVFNREGGILYIKKPKKSININSKPSLRLRDMMHLTQCVTLTSI